MLHAFCSVDFCNSCLQLVIVAEKVYIRLNRYIFKMIISIVMNLKFGYYLLLDQTRHSCEFSKVFDGSSDGGLENIKLFDDTSLDNNLIFVYYLPVSLTFNFLLAPNIAFSAF